MPIYVFDNANSFASKKRLKRVITFCELRRDNRDLLTMGDTDLPQHFNS